MNEDRKSDSLDRRRFLKQSATAACAVAAVGGVGLLIQNSRRKTIPDDGSENGNRFVYDASRFNSVDPKLIRYGEQRSVRCPREEARRIAIGPNDRLLVAAGNYVSILDESGNIELEIALNEPARCVGIGSDETVYVGLRGRVEVFSPKGQRLEAWEVGETRSWFTGIEVGENDVFLADAGNRVILRLDKGGTIRGLIGKRDPSRNVPGFVIPSPYFDLSLHPDGNLRVGNPGQHRVECYTLDGDFRYGWGRASAEIDGFCGCCNPVSVAHLADGRCVTAEKGLARVKIYSDSGEFESVVAGPEILGEEVFSEDDSFTEENHAIDVAVDSHGRIAILDAAAGKIRMMTEKT